MKRNVSAIIFRPRFINVHLPLGKYPHVAFLVESWQKAFPASVENPNVDFEDWVENAIRLHTAIECDQNLVAIVGGDNQAVFLNGQPVPDGTECVFLGNWREEDELGFLHPKRQSGVASRYSITNIDKQCLSSALDYAALATFRRHAGRQIVLCGVRASEDDKVKLDLYDCLAKMYQDGQRTAFIKVNLSKYMVCQINLVGPTRKAAMQAVMEDDGLSWATVHLEGRDEMFVVQEYVPLAYEYRVIVVNHSPVAGAGCVESMTPLDNQARWDYKAEEKRNNGGVVSVPEIVQLYREKASQFTSELRAENPECHSYTLDLAMSDGQPVVIELNPLENYGLYAMDYQAIVEAELGRM